MVNCFHEINFETGIECIWRRQSIIQVKVVFVIREHLPAYVNFILKPTLISFKFTILLFIMHIGSSYLLELLIKYPIFIFSYMTLFSNNFPLERAD